MQKLFTKVIHYINTPCGILPPGSFFHFVTFGLWEQPDKSETRIFIRQHKQIVNMLKNSVVAFDTNIFFTFSKSFKVINKLLYSCCAVLVAVHYLIFLFYICSLRSQETYQSHQECKNGLDQTFSLNFINSF